VFWPDREGRQIDFRQAERFSQKMTPDRADVNFLTARKAGFARPSG